MAKKRTDTWDGSERREAPTVLVASEHEAANELLRRVLDARGFRTLTAQTAEAAMGLASDHLPRVAILDLSSKGVGASMQVLDGIRHHDDPRVRACRAVVIARSNSNRNYAFQSGADGFLRRPYHVGDLLTVVSEVLSIPPEERARHRRDMIDLPVSAQ